MNTLAWAIVTAPAWFPLIVVMTFGTLRVAQGNEDVK